MLVSAILAGAIFNQIHFIYYSHFYQPSSEQRIYMLGDADMIQGTALEMCLNRLIYIMAQACRIWSILAAYVTDRIPTAIFEAVQ